MNILEFFGLKEDPFRLTPDPAYFFPSTGHNEALQSLNYLVEQREGFGLVSGGAWNREDHPYQCLYGKLEGQGGDRHDTHSSLVS